MRLHPPRRASFRFLAVPCALAACGLTPWAATAHAEPVVSAQPPAQQRAADGAVESVVLANDQAVVAAVAATSTLASATCADSGTKVFRQEFLKLTNSYRATGRYCGSTWYGATTPVAWSRELKRAANRHSRDMATNDFFSHTGSDGSSVGDRVSDTGYRWSAVGENIAAGYDSVASVMKGWIDSPGHCANIMSPRYRDLGVACAESANSQYGSYWTMVLAARL
ncbi:MAG TPA: CAP domain-containing protein [Ideonella sp.]|uniref:CAP domain-containing protein n=1 Tax=Ideonella sp. TaxID=1929293 RepID=UPI002E35ACDB|nr:CAP domain-containing protein [Ideonella sp.]HEX5686371.1 CAP domain-containing protein [Ideonella sp.]